MKTDHSCPPIFVQRFLLTTLFYFASIPVAFAADKIPQWDGKDNPTADQILENRLGFARPQYPEAPKKVEGFEVDLLGEVPEPGVHPRILFGPDQIADIRKRLTETKVGQKLKEAMTQRLNEGFRKKGSMTNRAITALAAGDLKTFEELYAPIRAKGQPEYNKTPVLFDLEVALFDALMTDNRAQGELAAKALASWARQLEPQVDEWRAGPAANNSSRWGSTHALGSYGLFGWHQLGLAYDFGAPFMSEKDRDDVRRVISKLTNGVYNFGMNLPPHLRMWNWINCGNYLPLLSLAIEGEEGYDPRVYERSVEMLADYLHHNYSKAGSSTEPVGYTSFGYTWGAEALLAMARRGDNLLTSAPYLAVPNWQVQCLSPYGSAFYSLGDGGNNPPTFDEIHLRKAFYPEDPVVDYLYSQVADGFLEQPDRYVNRRGRPFLAAVLATDPSQKDHQAGKDLKLPTTWTDPERGTLISRTGWSKDATKFHIESRPDSFYAGHEHADRGHFILSSHGRTWAPDGFRSVESRYHSVVLINGKGQGYFPAPGKVLEIDTSPEADFLVCDLSYAYDWFYPKAIVSVDPNTEKFKLKRFANYRQLAIDFQARFAKIEKDDHPNVVKAFKDVPLGDSGMWDEDPWTVRVPFNPVEYAFRTGGLVKGKHPYVLIVDDIQKDNAVHLYEWLMMLQMDTIPLSIKVHDNPRGVGHQKADIPDSVYTDILLGSDTIPRKGNRYQPKKGEPLLLVRILEANNPEPGPDFAGTPQPRVETFEKKDFRYEPSGRTFGLDKRLVIPSRSISPKFKILLYPHKFGDPLPETNYMASKQDFTIQIGDQIDTVEVKPLKSGRTGLKISRKGKVITNTLP